MSNTTTVKKSNIGGAVIVALTFSAVMVSLFLWYWHNEKVVEQANYINDCKSQGYDQMASLGLIGESTTPEQVVLNCETLETRIHNILDGYDAEWFPVYVTGHLITDCGEYSTGCVTSRHDGIAKVIPGIIPPVMTISYTADYDLNGLEHTVTHEYVHTLTSGEEGDYLNANNPEIWGGLNPLEGVADCGVSYFMEFKGGTYMAECSPEQTAIAYAVINDTLVP